MPDHGKAIHSIPIAMTVVAIGTGFLHPMIGESLQYSSDFVQSGEVWRLLTAHVVHLDRVHLGLNIVGLWLVWALIGNAFNADQWILLLVVTSLSITVGLRVFSPEIQWYVGLSGVTYGMLAAGLLMKAESFHSLSSSLLALVLLKVLVDVFVGPISLIHLGGQRVVVDAHVYGIVSGLGVAAIYRLTGFLRPLSSSQVNDVHW